MSSAIRIGELLLLREALDPWVLTRAIQDQPATGQRLVSLLISRALIDPDDGALALAEQLNYPAAMQRHLERRDPAVVDALPAEVCRRWGVLPLGRSRLGGLVVVARDPTPILAASLKHVARTHVELAVTPSLQLERLVRSVYGEIEAPAPQPAPPLHAPAPLADLRLDEDEPKPRRSRTVSRVLLETGPDLPRMRPQAATFELDATLVHIERAINRAAAEQQAMAFAARQWTAALLTTTRDDHARGRRGHGPGLTAVEDVRLPLTAPSQIQLAYQTRHATQVQPEGEVQAQLAALLGNPREPAAAPIIVAGHVEAVLAVGDPVASELRNPLSKLAALADALGAAYERLPR